MANYNLVVMDDTEFLASRLRARFKDIGAKINVHYAADVETINEIGDKIHAFVIAIRFLTRGSRIDTGDAVCFVLEETRGEGARNRRTLYRSDGFERIADQIAKELIVKSRVIGVFGVGGGAGNTTMCMGLAQGLAQQGKRVFVLSLEAYIAKLPFTGADSTGLAEVLIALEDPDKLEETIVRACYKSSPNDKITSFATGEYNVDRVELKRGDMKLLLETMCQMNRWDVILVDLESRMGDVLFEVWESATRMILMIPSTGIGREKLEQVSRDLEMRQNRGEAELNKLVPVLNFAVNEEPPMSVARVPVRRKLPRFIPADKMHDVSSAWMFRTLADPRLQQYFKPVLDEVTQ